MSDFLTSEELSKACELHSARDRDVCEYIKLAWHRIMDSEIEYVPNFSILDKLYENSHILYEWFSLELNSIIVGSE